MLSQASASPLVRSHRLPTRLAAARIVHPRHQQGPLQHATVLRTRQGLVCRAQDEDYFDEGAAQVKRLLDRDRKEILREQNEKAEYDTEFDRPSSSRDSQNGSSSSSSAANGSNGASTSQPDAYEEELSSMRNPMRQSYKSPPKKGAFGSSTKSPFGSESAGFSNQKDMWAAMEPVEDDDDVPWWKSVTFGQVAIVLSFLTIIGLMLGTVWVTVKLGGVHFNE